MGLDAWLKAPIPTCENPVPSAERFEMLALSRGEGQSIIINGTIEVKIVKWSRSSVRLAIEAPRDVSIDRDEVWRRMHPGVPTPLDQAHLARAADGGHLPGAGSLPTEGTEPPDSQVV